MPIENNLVTVLSRTMKNYFTSRALLVFKLGKSTENLSLIVSFVRKDFCLLDMLSK